MRSRRGSSLLEVLVALVVLTSSLGAAAGLIAGAARAQGLARQRVLAALTLAERVEALRAAAGRTTPRCLALAGGNASSPPVTEAWRVTRTGAMALVELRVLVAGPVAVADSLEAVLACD